METNCSSIDEIDIKDEPLDLDSFEVFTSDLALIGTDNVPLTL